MKEIPLGKTGLVALVDDEDFELVSQHHWCVRRNKGAKTYYVQHTVKLGVNQWTTETMHRFILKLGKGRDVQVDHIDGNGLNNQKNNLRLCNASQNAANRTKQNRSRSKYKGVSWQSADGGKWRCSVMANGQLRWMGCFGNEREAALAYDRAAREMFGDFAKCNFPLQEETV